MKHLILAAVLLTGFNPAMAQQMRGPLDTRTTDSERANAHPYVAPPDGKLRLQADMARPCTVAMAFGCRTGDK